MDTIKHRAEAYALRIQKEQEDAYIFTSAEVLVEEAYEAGAREERHELLRWRHPIAELPKIGADVLVRRGIGWCFVGYLDQYKIFRSSANPIEHYHPQEVLGWRYIETE